MSFADAFHDEVRKLAANRLQKEMRRRLGMKHNEPWSYARHAQLSGKSLATPHGPVSLDVLNSAVPTVGASRSMRLSPGATFGGWTGGDLANSARRHSSPVGARLQGNREILSDAAGVRLAQSGIRGHLPRPGELILPKINTKTVQTASITAGASPRLPWVFRGNPKAPQGVTHASRHPDVAASYAADNVNSLVTPPTGRLFAFPRRGFREGPAFSGVLPPFGRAAPAPASLLPAGVASSNLIGAPDQQQVTQMQRNLRPGYALTMPPEKLNQRSARALGLTEHQVRQLQAAAADPAMASRLAPLHPHYEAAQPAAQVMNPVGEYKVRKVMAAGKPSYAVSHVGGLPLQTAFKPWLGGGA